MNKENEEGPLAKIDAIEKGPASVTTELTPQNCKYIIDLLRAAESNGDKLYDVRMEECAGSNDPGASEWFVLWPKKDMEREVPSKNGLNAIKADRIRGNEQIRAFHGADSNVDCFVSEKAKTAIEKERLRGLEFIWARDAGKFQAPQWYHIFATPPLGRGVDHPWFDPQALADAIFLDTSKISRDGDCPILLLDHETGETAVEWPNIPSFLTELFTRQTE